MMVVKTVFIKVKKAMRPSQGRRADDRTIEDCNTPESKRFRSTLYTEQNHTYHHPTYSFVVASCKKIDPKIVEWTIQALYIGLTYLNNHDGTKPSIKSY
jgi:hypothetical protein